MRDLPTSSASIAHTFFTVEYATSLVLDDEPTLMALDEPFKFRVSDRPFCLGRKKSPQRLRRNFFSQFFDRYLTVASPHPEASEIGPSLGEKRFDCPDETIPAKSVMGRALTNIIWQSIAPAAFALD
jgi:hypothetical protein